MGKATKFFRFCRIYRGNPSRDRFVVILRSIATKDLLLPASSRPAACRDSSIRACLRSRGPSVRRAARACPRVKPRDQQADTKRCQHPISLFTGPVSFAGPVEPSEHCVFCQLNPLAPSYNTKLYKENRRKFANFQKPCLPFVCQNRCHLLSLYRLGKSRTADNRLTG